MKNGLGRQYTECVKLVNECLAIAKFDQRLFEETSNWQPPSKSHSLKIDQAVSIPRSLKTLKLNLGWDTQIDIDVALILFDKWGNHIESVQVGHKTSSDGAITLSDNKKTLRPEKDDDIAVQLEKVTLIC